MTTLNLVATEVGADWLRARRLGILADAGDEKARRELDRMEKTKMYILKGVKV